MTSNALEKRRILIVDDSPTARTFAARALAAAGYDVETAADMFIAPVVTRFRPHLILMDFHIGQHKGDVAIKALKKRAFARGVRLVLYSSLSESEMADIAKESGADGVISKADGLQRLISGVKALLSDRDLASGGARS